MMTGMEIASVIGASGLLVALVFAMVVSWRVSRQAARAIKKCEATVEDLDLAAIKISSLERTLDDRNTKLITANARVTALNLEAMRDLEALQACKEELDPLNEKYDVLLVKLEDITLKHNSLVDDAVKIANLKQDLELAVLFFIKKVQTRKFLDPKEAMLTSTQAWARLVRVYGQVTPLKRGAKEEAVGDTANTDEQPATV